MPLSLGKQGAQAVGVKAVNAFTEKAYLESETQDKPLG